MNFEFGCTFNIGIPNCEFNTLLKAYSEMMPKIQDDFMNKILLGYAEFFMRQDKKPFSCPDCGNDRAFTWKTRHGRKTKILTIFKEAHINQLQVKCRRCRRKFNITRKLLGLEPRIKVPESTRKKMGLLGALASYRVSEKITSMFGWVIDKMTIWRAVQSTAKDIKFGLDPDELPHGEADGKAIGIQGIKKRGKELKVFVQLKKSGKVRIAGLSIGDYNSGWDRLFKPLISGFKKFKQFLLVTDGDTNILKGLKGKVKVIFQRCLWHIPHQLKYYLWKDGVKRKSREWLHALARIFEICAIRPFVEDGAVIRKMVADKEERLENLICYCETKGFKNCATHLRNAAPDMFTAIKKKLEGKTISRAERVMRTINLRTGVGKWKPQSALNAVKIRLAYYYNGFDA